MSAGNRGILAVNTMQRAAAEEHGAGAGFAADAGFLPQMQGGARYPYTVAFPAIAAFSMCSVRITFSFA